MTLWDYQIWFTDGSLAHVSCWGLRKIGQASLTLLRTHHFPIPKKCQFSSQTQNFLVPRYQTRTILVLLRTIIVVTLLWASACVILAARKFCSFIGTPLSPNSKLFTNGVLSLTHVTAFDTMLAEKLLLIKSQIDSFGAENLLVRESKLLKKTSRLFPFSPRLHDGLPVMDSRIKSLPTEDEIIRKRILLDDRHRVVRLLVTHH